MAVTEASSDEAQYARDLAADQAEASDAPDATEPSESSESLGQENAESSIDEAGAARELRQQQASAAPPQPDPATQDASDENSDKESSSGLAAGMSIYFQRRALRMLFGKGLGQAMRSFLMSILTFIAPFLLYGLLILFLLLLGVFIYFLLTDSLPWFNLGGSVDSGSVQGTPTGLAGLETVDHNF